MDLIGTIVPNHSIHFQLFCEECRREFLLAYACSNAFDLLSNDGPIESNMQYDTILCL